MRDVLAGKTPLYRLHEQWTTMDVEILVGAGRPADEFSDDSLGRALGQYVAVAVGRVCHIRVSVK